MTQDHDTPAPKDSFYGSVLEDMFLALETDHFAKLAKTHKDLSLDEFAFVIPIRWPQSPKDLAAE